MKQFNIVAGEANMITKKPKRELVGIWQIFHLIIWLGGLYYLFSRGNIFPGILVLILISAIYEALLQRFVPRAYKEQPQTEAASPMGDVISKPGSIAAPASPPEHRIELLPQVCPSCNGPIRGHEVKWTGPQSADCPYCGTNLPMSK
jgi:hypothetical protein